MAKPVRSGQRAVVNSEGGVTLPVMFSGMKFGCPLCPGRFPTMGAKRAHLRDTHPEERNAKRAR